ncbi:Histone PARylation factor 1 [Frankliniella fusca]|uniref:Histone PARylation factor 1 n=1 Tax=Frankliniella fusca TaxID=407009 RepID=A0AAE1H2A5_9NEOP|nr:Histone PARylation factor 1 [Frankliniella fusca]
MAGDTGTSLNCETIEEFQSDPRIACKYGHKCYQTNPVHLSKYKHPPKIKASSRKGAKRFKKAGPTPKAPSCSDEERISDDSSGSSSPKRKALSAKPPCTDGDGGNAKPSSSHNLGSTPSSEHSTDLFETEPIMPPSPTDIKLNIKQKFLFEMPEDFYSFWDFCQSLNGLNPALAFKDVGLELVGPYDLLSSHFKLDSKKKKQSFFLLHWRYYYDPPGFQTVLKGDDKKQYHIGYYRDEPKSMPAFLASNCAAKDGVFTPVGENIFGAVNEVLLESKKSATPFLQPKIQKFQQAIQNYAKEHGFTLETRTAAMKLRDRKTVCKTFNGLGLLVPVEKKTEVGYRELIETDANLKRILKRITESENEDLKEKARDQLQQVVTAANIANDECDFGTSVELGLDLFAFGGSEFEQTALQLLSTGYSLLGRPEFAKVAQIHINNRRKGSQLDMLNS